jgi:hypothetical protein
MLERAEDDRPRVFLLHKEEAVECYNTGHIGGHGMYLAAFRQAFRC